MIDIPQSDLKIISISQPVSAFKVHPRNPFTFACGGSRRDLEIYKSTDLLSVTRKFKARRNTRSKGPLRLKIVTWLSDIQFVDIDRESDQSWRVVTTSRYGEIFLYETSVSKRPIVQVMASYNPITSIWFGGNEHELIYIDTQFNVGKFDSVTGQAEFLFSDEPSTRVLSMAASYVLEAKQKPASLPNSNTSSHTTVITSESNRPSPDQENEPEGACFSRAPNDPSLKFKLYEPRFKGSPDHVVFRRGINVIETDIPSFSDRIIPAQTLSSNPDISSRSINANSTCNSNHPTPNIILATGGLDPYLRIYDWETKKLISKLNMGSKITKVLIIDSSLAGNTPPTLFCQSVCETKRKLQLEDNQPSQAGDELTSADTQSSKRAKLE